MEFRFQLWLLGVDLRETHDITKDPYFQDLADALVIIGSDNLHLGVGSFSTVYHMGDLTQKFTSRT